MSDAAYIELPAPKKKKRYFRGWRLWLLLALIAVCLVFYWFWWEYEGKIRSSYASVDAVVFTVEPEAPVVVREVLVRKGEQVFPGQPLAAVEVASQTPQPLPSQPPSNEIMPVGEIAGRLDASEAAERNMSVRISQARAQEERFQQAHQNMVTEHVRAQLALRATDPGNPVAWAAANGNEMAARARMEAAREAYENVSKMRAAMDTELVRIRSEINRKKIQAARNALNAPAKKAEQAPPPPPAAPQTMETTLLAPASGKIVEVFAAPGQHARQGQSLFFIMPGKEGKPADSWVEAWFPVSEREKIKLGQKAEIRVDNWRFFGEIVDISPEIKYRPDASSGNGNDYARYVVVRISVNDPDALAAIKPGTEAVCEVQTRSFPGF